MGNNVKKDTVALTPRQLGERMAFCGGGNMPIGTPDMVADVFEEWINVGDIDGFNVACKSHGVTSICSLHHLAKIVLTWSPLRYLQPGIL